MINILIGYNNNYNLDWFLKLGSSYKQAQKCFMFIEVDDNRFIELNDLKKIYELLSENYNEYFPYIIKNEVGENWTLNFNIIDRCLVILRVKNKNI